MARCSVLLREKVLCFVSRVSKSVTCEMFSILSVPKTLSEKLYLLLYLTQIDHSNGKMFFIQPIIVYQSFYGALLTFSYFSLQKSCVSESAVGMSLAR